jgi:MFS family permease
MRPRSAVVLGTCCLSLFLTGLDNTAVNVGLPMIGAQLHAPVAGLQWVVAAYTVVLASLLMLAGALADRFGRKSVFQAGLCLFTLGSWLCSLAPGLAWLVAFRALQGAGAGGRSSGRTSRWDLRPSA